MPHAITIRRHSIKAQRRFIKYSFFIVMCMNILLWGIILVKFLRNFKKII